MWPLFVVLGLVAAFIAGYRWYENGISLTLVTNPAMSMVSLDDKPVGVSDSSGRLILPHIARGSHSITVSHDGYQPYIQTQIIGSFALNAAYNLTLLQQTYRVTVQTRPPFSNVYVDDKLAGKSDAFGVLIIPAVSDGQHILKIQSTGFPIETMPIEIHSDNLVYNIDLAAKMAEMIQEKSADLQRAHELFQLQNFDAAIAACDAVLGIFPNDADATSLRAQIQQTKAIVSH
jgi:hypothetical protein